MTRPFSRTLYLLGAAPGRRRAAVRGAGHGPGTASSGGASRAGHAVPGCDARVHRRTLRRRRHAHREARSEGSQRRGAARTRGDCPRAVQRRGNLAAGRRRRVRRRARPPSSSASCSRCSAARRRDDAVARGRAGRHVADRRRSRPGGPRAAGARSIPGSQRRVPRRRGAGAGQRRHPDRLGRSVPREIQQGRSGQVVPGGPRNRSALGSRARRRRARARRRQPAAGRIPRQARSRDQPVLGGRPRLSREPGDRRRAPRRGARAADEGARDQSVQPRRAQHARGAGLRRGQDRRNSRPRWRRCWPSRRIAARCTASPASWSRTTTASRRR